MQKLDGTPKWFAEMKKETPTDWKYKIAAVIISVMFIAIGVYLKSIIKQVNAKVVSCYCSDLCLCQVEYGEYISEIATDGILPKDSNILVEVDKDGLNYCCYKTNSAFALILSGSILFAISAFS
jgi:hypothetical protein